MILTDDEFKQAWHPRDKTTLIKRRAKQLGIKVTKDHWGYWFDDLPLRPLSAQDAWDKLNGEAK